MTARTPASPSAFDALERWRALQPPPPPDRPFTARDATAELIASHLDSCAYEHLSKPDRVWWEERWNADEEAGAFSRLFGPEWLVQTMDAFLGWFLIRKVMAHGDELAEYAANCMDLVAWLQAEGLVTDADLVRHARARASRAAAELPQSEELGSLLHFSADHLGPGDVVAMEDWVDRMAQIVRIEPGSLWFRDEDGEEIGPVIVPARASEIARTGWSVSAASFGMTTEGWYLLEMGNVYPA